MITQRYFLLTCLLTLMGLLTSCGKTGDLYLPDEKPASSHTRQTAAPVKP